MDAVAGEIDDLLKVVAVLSQEMNNLGIDTPSTSIVLIDEDNDQRIDYAAIDNPEKFGVSWSSTSWLKYDENTIVGVYARLSLKDVEESDFALDRKVLEEPRPVDKVAREGLAAGCWGCNGPTRPNEPGPN